MATKETNTIGSYKITKQKNISPEYNMYKDVLVMSAGGVLRYGQILEYSSSKANNFTSGGSNQVLGINMNTDDTAADVQIDIATRGNFREDLVWFKQVDSFTGNGTATEFTLSHSLANDFDTDDIVVTVGGTAVTTYSYASGVITFDTAPADEAAITVTYDARPTIADILRIKKETGILIDQVY